MPVVDHKKECSQIAVNDPIHPNTDSPHRPKGGDPPSGFLSTDEIGSQIKKPTTPLEILKNILLIMDHDLLIREDFYTEERLKHFCGAEKVHFHSCDKSSPEATLRCNLTGFSKIAPSFKANIRSGREFWQDAYEFIIDQRYKNGVLEYGLIQWHCHIKDPHLSFDKIEELMGSPKKITSLPIQAIRKGDVATHRLGHKGLEYLSKVSRNPGTIWLSLQSNGTLLMAGFKTNRETPPSPSV